MRAYRMLLWLFPASFRGEYAAMMAADHAARRREAEGALGVAGFWIGAVADVLRNAAGAHLDLLRQDLRWAGRSLRNAPGFAFTAVTVVALGVGATTAGWSVLDHVLLRPLPFPSTERLVKLYQHQVATGYQRLELSPANYRDWKAGTRSFAALGAYVRTSANLAGAGDPVRVVGADVTAEVIGLLGVRPALGRAFAPEEDDLGAPGTVVLSHRLWQQHFGGERGAVGREILLDDAPHTVIGVMPPAFRFPNRDALFWKPLRLDDDDYEDRANCYLVGIGRLARGVSLDEARTEMQLVASRVDRAHPDTNSEIAATVVGLRDEVGRGSRLLVVALFGASLCVLLVACTNLASLLLARALGRRKEVALRAALGAGRERLVRQVLVESLVLATLGGVLGGVLALLGTPLAARLVPSGLPLAVEPAVDLRVLAAALAATVATGLGFGIVPALGAARGASADALREGTRAGAGRRGERLRAALVVAEVALSVGLLVATGLLGRALLRVRDVDPGFRADGVLTLRTWMPRPRYDEVARRHAFTERVLAEVSALRGVESAAYVSFAPMVMGGGIWPVELPGREPPAPLAALRFVTPGYFATLAIPLLAGRDVDASDDAEAPWVAVVSASLARDLWPGQDPLGRRFEFGLAERTVVGVVGDIRERGLEGESEPQIYLPSRQVPDGGLLFYDVKDLVVRSTLSPEELAPAVRRIVAAADPTLPVSDVRPLADVVADDVAPRAVQARVLAAFAAVTLLLAGVGIHGLFAHVVAARRPELAVRVALGARGRDLVGALGRRLALLLATGLAAGALLAAFAGRALQALLAGVSPADPTTLGVVLGVLLATAVAGAVGPTVTAARADPLEAMRAE